MRFIPVLIALVALVGCGGDDESARDSAYGGGDAPEGPTLVFDFEQRCEGTGQEPEETPGCAPESAVAPGTAFTIDGARQGGAISVDEPDRSWTIRYLGSSVEDETVQTSEGEEEVQEISVDLELTLHEGETATSTDSILPVNVDSDGGVIDECEEEYSIDTDTIEAGETVETTWCLRTRAGNPLEGDESLVLQPFGFDVDSAFLELER